MAKILVVTSGLTGIFNASTQLIYYLTEMGHEVVSASPRQDIDVENLPFDHIVLKPLYQKPVIQIDSDHSRKGIRGLFIKHFKKKERINEAVDRVEPKDFIPLVKSCQPDLLILDIEMHEYIIEAYGTGTPILLLNQFFALWTSATLPDIQSSRMPSDGSWYSKFDLRKAYYQLITKRNWKLYKQSILSGGVNRKEILVRMAKKWKFPLQFLGDNLWPGPFVYEKLPVANMNIEALDFPHKKRENSYYIGAFVNLDRKDKRAKTSNSYTLEDVLSESNKRNAKIIYCSVSTMQAGDGAFLEKVVNAMLKLPLWTMVLSVGKYVNEDRFKNKPNNVFSFSHVPQIKVLSQASLAIIHGGVHTINECIQLNVPMLVYSGKKADQNGCAARLMYHGLAYAGDKDLDTSDNIADKILSLSRDEKVKKNINVMRELNNNQLSSNYFEVLIDRAIDRELEP